MSETKLQRQTLQAGDRIFKESEKGHLAYIVQSGEVEIFKVIDGLETVLGRIGQGGIFGEMALIDFHPEWPAPGPRRGRPSSSSTAPPSSKR